MKWIESSGGPLVLVPTDQLWNWRGTNPSLRGNRTDYDRACDIADYVGLLDVGDAIALVLGDEPFRTTWIPTDSGGGAIVQWVYADSEASVINYITQTNLEHLTEDSGISIELRGSCTLFDAAEPGSDIRGNSVVVDLENGTYGIDSALVDVSPETRLIFHQLALLR